LHEKLGIWRMGKLPPQPTHIGGTHPLTWVPPI